MKNRLAGVCDLYTKEDFSLLFPPLGGNSKITEFLDYVHFRRIIPQKE